MKSLAILTRYQKHKDENKQSCHLILQYNDDLRLAHSLKVWFYEICQNIKYSSQRTAFGDWIKNAESSGIHEFETCAKTYKNWSDGILNAFKYGYTNGPTEGFNVSGGTYSVVTFTPCFDILYPMTLNVG